MVIKETQRLHSVVPNVLRIPIKNVNLLGYNIEKSTNVMVYIDGLHNDGGLWSRGKPVNEFDPERWRDFTPKPGVFMPFGDGPMNCKLHTRDGSCNVHFRYWPETCPDRNEVCFDQ